jgi:hypothetical protein
VSWKATAWAKETRGHAGYATKTLLYTLADYHDTEKDLAWPSQTTLSDDCEMPLRTVQHSLAWLETRGFITTVQKGNQYQPTHYRLNFSVAGAQSYEPATSGPATIAPASEPATSDIVNPQRDTSEPATPVGTSLQEPPLEPPEENTLVESKWIQVLERDPRWTAREGYAEDVEELYAQTIDIHSEAVRAYEWLQTTGGRKRLKLGLFFLNWLKRAMPSDNGSKPTMTRAERLRADHKAYEKGE